MRLPASLLGGLAALALVACNNPVHVESSASAGSNGDATATATAPGARPVSGDANDAHASAPAPAPDGLAAPDFTLTDTTGQAHSLAAYMADGKTVVLEWFNPECPVSKGYYTPKPLMASAYGRVTGDDVVWLAINSGGPGKQGTGVARNEAARTAWSMPYPVLLDESGAVGKAYEAKTTPHMFVIRDGKIVYRGAIDASKTGAPGTNYVVDAITSLRAGRPVTVSETRPFGCGVKFAD